MGDFLDGGFGGAMMADADQSPACGSTGRPGAHETTLSSSTTEMRTGKVLPPLGCSLFMLLASSVWRTASARRQFHETCKRSRGSVSRTLVPPAGGVLKSQPTSDLLQAPAEIGQSVAFNRVGWKASAVVLHADFEGPSGSIRGQRAPR